MKSLHRIVALMSPLWIFVLCSCDPPPVRDAAIPRADVRVILADAGSSDRQSQADRSQPDTAGGTDTWRPDTQPGPDATGPDSTSPDSNAPDTASPDATTTDLYRPDTTTPPDIAPPADRTGTDLFVVVPDSAVPDPDATATDTWGVDQLVLPDAAAADATAEDAGPCQGVSAIGECDGTTLRYCSTENRLVQMDCAASTGHCGLVDCELASCFGYACVAGPGEDCSQAFCDNTHGCRNGVCSQTADCDSQTFQRSCESDRVVFCSFGKVSDVDCTLGGQVPATCGPHSTSEFNCVGTEGASCDLTATPAVECNTGLECINGICAVNASTWNPSYYGVECVDDNGCPGGTCYSFFTDATVPKGCFKNCLDTGDCSDFPYTAPSLRCLIPPSATGRVCFAESPQNGPCGNNVTAVCSANDQICGAVDNIGWCVRICNPSDPTNSAACRVSGIPTEVCGCLGSNTCSRHPLSWNSGVPDDPDGLCAPPSTPGDSCGIIQETYNILTCSEGQNCMEPEGDAGPNGVCQNVDAG